MSIDLAADLRDARGAGRLTAGVAIGPTVNKAKLSISQFPLSILRPLAARLVPGATITGRLSSEIGATWGNKAADQNVVEGALSVEGFSLATRAMQTDVLQLANLQADCHALWQTDRIDVTKSSIRCDLGNAALVGTVPLGGKDGFSFAALMHQRQSSAASWTLPSLPNCCPARWAFARKCRSIPARYNACGRAYPMRRARNGTGNWRPAT